MVFNQDLYQEFLDADTTPMTNETSRNTSVGSSGYGTQDTEEANYFSSHSVKEESEPSPLYQGYTIEELKHLLDSHWNSNGSNELLIHLAPQEFVDAVTHSSEFYTLPEAPVPASVHHDQAFEDSHEVYETNQPETAHQEHTSVPRVAVPEPEFVGYSDREYEAGTYSNQQSVLDFSTESYSEQNQEPECNTDPVSQENTQTSEDQMEIDVLNLDPEKTSFRVQKSIRAEFALQDKYFAAIAKGKQSFLQEKIRKRRNPTCDDLVWQPVSVFQAAYTNIKLHPLDKTDYFSVLPQQSCFGRINMRVKRAWNRGPNRKRLRQNIRDIEYALNGLHSTEYSV